MRVLLIALTALLLPAAGPALAQDLCANEYGACMNRCATMNHSPVQDRCFVACQTSNDACAAKVFGSWRAPFGKPVPGADAMAKQPETDNRTPQRR